MQHVLHPYIRLKSTLNKMALKEKFILNTISFFLYLFSHFELHIGNLRNDFNVRFKFAKNSLTILPLER